MLQCSIRETIVSVCNTLNYVTLNYVACDAVVCRSCILRYLESSQTCPVCDVPLHENNPKLGIRYLSMSEGETCLEDLHCVFAGCSSDMRSAPVRLRGLLMKGKERYSVVFVLVLNASYTD